MEGTFGEIRIFAGNFAPVNWLFCEGQLLPISSNQALFSLLGTGYGGDGKSSFGLPNLTSPAEVTGTNQGRYIICVRGVYPSRD